MKKLIFLGVLGFTCASAAAGFSFEKETCAITSTNDLLFEIEAENFSSQVRVDFYFEGANILLPKVRFKFLQHVPAKVSFSWKTILAERGGVQLFRAEIRDRLRQEEGRLFEMKKVSASGEMAVFETSLFDLDRSQDLVALFLSQNELIVNAHTAENDVWQAKLPLSFSDTAFRKMGAQCYASITAKYLKPSGERAEIENPDGEKLSPAALHWSEGYGLTNFTGLNGLLPQGLNAVGALEFRLESSGGDESVANKMLADFVGLVKEKRSAQETLKAKSSDPRYVALNDQLAFEYKTLQEQYGRFVALTGNSPQATDSLIAQKIKLQNDLETTLNKISVAIADHLSSQDGTIEHLEVVEETLAPHLENISALKQKLGQHEARIEQIKLLLEHLVDLLQKNQEQLGREADIGETLEGAPWTMEQIEKAHLENLERRKTINMVSALKIQMESLVGELNLLVEKASAQETAANAYLTAAGENRETKELGLAALRRKLAAEDSWLVWSSQAPNFTVATPEFYARLNDKVEVDLAEKFSVESKVRDRTAESEYNKKLYTTLEEQFNSLRTNALALQTSDGSALMIASILCAPNVLLDVKNRTQPCLTLDEALDDQTVEHFFLSLPPITVDTLLGEVERPWSQDLSKTQVLMGRFQKEFNEPTMVLQELVDKWAEVRHVLWRINTMQKGDQALAICGDARPAELFAEKIYTKLFYDTVFRCEKADVERHLSQRTSLLSTIATTQSGLAQKEEAFNLADREFTEMSEQFVNVSLKRISDVGAQADLSFVFAVCGLPLDKAEICRSTITGGVSEAQNLVAQEQSSYLDVARALVMNINAQTSILTEENRLLVAEGAKVSNSMQEYAKSNNVDGLLAEKLALEKQIEHLISEISKLEGEKSKTVESLNSAKVEQGILYAEAQNLMTQIQATSQKMKGLMSSFTPYCENIRPIGERLQQIDASFYALLAPGESKHETKMYTSCQLPNLENFIPHSEAFSSSVGTSPK